MILDTLENADLYGVLGDGFRQAFEFLGRPDLAELEPGKIEISDSLYAIVLKEHGRRKEDCEIETHRDWIDIQYVIAGVDEMGWRPASACMDPVSDYDPVKDLQFFRDEPDTWFRVGPASFAIFFPEDAHLPMISDGDLHKIVIKIRA